MERYLSFSLDELELAIPLLTVKEVIALPSITPIPHAPPHMLGLSDLRGQVVPVIDLRAKFQMKKGERTSECATIICMVGDKLAGIVVDSVNSVIAIPEEKIQQVPDLQMNGVNGNCLSGVFQTESRLTLLLDVSRTLQTDTTHSRPSTPKAA
jgi:purine-binding chemotaxis protein CheW